MRRLLLFCILAILVAAGALLFAGRTPRPPNVLIITLDTVRADAIGPGQGTPAIEAFLQQATRFNGARTTMPLTLPAHVSMFSGLLPATHGVHDNSTPCGSPGSGRDYPLLAEQLRERGYRTAAFIASRVMAEQTGIDAGFDLFSCPEENDAALGEREYLPAEIRVGRALNWIWSAPAETPWMAWVHLYDAHAPYERWNGDSQREGTPANPAVRERYAAEVRRMDAAVDDLLAAAGPETIVVLVSDHGEGLGEHGESWHGLLCYASCVDIFLAVRGPGLEPGAVDEGPRSIMDVATTLRDWCGVPRSHDEGRPLGGEPHAVVTTETLRAWRVHNLGQCFAAFDGRHTLIESGSSLVLHDRSGDPFEERAIDPSGHFVYERLDRAIQHMRSAERLPPGAEPPILETVGPYHALRRRTVQYLTSSENAKLDDPQVHIALLEELEALHVDIHCSVCSRDVPALKRALARAQQLSVKLPQSPVPYEMQATSASGLAAFTGQAGYWQVAASAAIREIELGHDSWGILGEALEYAIRSGSPDRVARVVELALSRDSRFPPELLKRCRKAAEDLPGRPGRVLRARLP